MSQTGENDQALRKILDMTRLISIVLLILHFYYYLYDAFRFWKLTLDLTDRILVNITHTGLFARFHTSKLFSLLFLVIGLVGAKGRKSEKINYKSTCAYIFTGLLLFFISYFILFANLSADLTALLYMSCTVMGYLLCLVGGTYLSRIIKNGLQEDIFNEENETFPQQTEKITNDNSVNLPMRYMYKGKWNAGWLNITTGVRGCLVQGSAGAGKTAFVLRHVISQLLAKRVPNSFLIYDFKFPDLSLIAYNHYLKNKHKYKTKSGCYFINFDDLSRSHRCNVFDPLGMIDITDAAESSRTILLALNKQWQTKTGDFFVESAINFVNAVIWYLRKYRDGIYCTLPHALEMIDLEYDVLFSIMRTEITIRSLINNFINAYINDVMEQLEGQIGSAKVALARLSSPQLYWVLSGNDFTLDINNPMHPKILCMGNNPLKIQTYGAVLSLYGNRLLKIINQKGKVPCALVIDEYASLVLDLNMTVASGRSNLISTFIGVQEVAQIRKEYGKESADVIINMVANIISGQVSGDSAKQLSERIGKINQSKTSMSIGNDVSFSKSKQLDYAVPASKISNMSSGEFAGVLADSPAQPMKLKAFHCQILNDFEAINLEEKNYKPIPIIHQVTDEMVMENYHRIKQDIQDLANSELERMLSDPELESLVIRK